MPPMTSIKVPSALRDRLALRARASHTTLAGALERALDESEEQEFWGAVREANASGRMADGGRAALRDGLVDADDDALGRDGW